MMFQDARLLPWKRVLGQRLPRPHPERRADAVAALEEVGLGERGGDWPSILSGGQRQRVALARALASRPQVLLLDEPLGALDALTRLDMQGLIERVWREHGFTAVLVTHDVEEAVALADRIIVLSDGLVALDDRVDLPRPRDHATPRFTEIKKAVLDEVLGVRNEPPCACTRSPRPPRPARHRLTTRGTAWRRQIVSSRAREESRSPLPSPGSTERGRGEGARDDPISKPAIDGGCRERFPEPPR